MVGDIVIPILQHLNLFTRYEGSGLLVNTCSLIHLKELVATLG